jgi:regulator of nucleoside diphosphate kinase
MTSTVHLTARDRLFLESLLLDPRHADDYLHLLRHKLETANVVPTELVPARIATVDSRIAFSVGGGTAEQRVLSRDEKSSTHGLSLPVTTMRGLALLGLKEGDIYPLRKPNGIIEPLRLEKVCYQPESARRREHAAATAAVLQFRSGSHAVGAAAHVTNDDPGPTAA